MKYKLTDLTNTPVNHPVMWEGFELTEKKVRNWDLGKGCTTTDVVIKRTTDEKYFKIQTITTEDDWWYVEESAVEVVPVQKTITVYE